MIDIYICDFEDSFTFNIYAELAELYNRDRIQIIDKSDVVERLTQLNKIQDPKLIILGPGPGHPDAYWQVTKLLKDLFKKENLFFFGVCLGHQLVAQVFGASIKKASNPSHGERQKYHIEANLQSILNIKSHSISVQRYNSLAVKSGYQVKSNSSVVTLEHQGEVIIYKGQRVLTYQFHPESVGTTCPVNFFTPLKDFLL